MKDFVGGILEGILKYMAYSTRQEQALALELSHVKGQLRDATTRAETFTTIADERLALLTASAALADERAGLLTAVAARAENAEKLLDLERAEHDLATKNTVRLELRIEALKRRRERLQAELRSAQDQLADADVSGRIRNLQNENAQLQQRLADLQTYFEEKRGSAPPR